MKDKEEILSKNILEIVAGNKKKLKKKVMITLDPEVHKDSSDLLKSQGMSLSGFINFILDSIVQTYKREGDKKKE